MIKKLILIIHLFLITAVEGKAQFELELFSFEEEVMNISASRNQKLDINGDPTALLKIVIPRLKGIAVESPVLISQEVNDMGETLAYLGDRSVKVTVRHPDFLPFVYKFEQPLQAKHVYTLTLKAPVSYFSSDRDRREKALQVALLLSQAEKLREERKPEQALSLYKKISDNPEAQFHIGEHHYHQKNFKEALEWFIKSAEQGYVSAQACLGEMYFKGKGTMQDYTVSAKWYRKAAAQGDPYSQNSMGLLYMKGDGVEVDMYEAAKWFRLSAEQGYLEAQFNVGLTYYEGWGVPKDYNESVKWYRKAAEQGDMASQFNLALMYEKGEGVQQDYALAFDWCRKAAEQGHTLAQNRLGSMYQSGKGVDKDAKLAVEWYTKAAEGGLSEAQYNLGKAYAMGKGCQQDRNKAKEWLAKAADQGHKDADSLLKVLNEKDDNELIYYLLIDEEVDKKMLEWIESAKEKKTNKSSTN